MTGEVGFVQIGDIIADDSFPDMDLALRRGRHIDRDDGAWYALLVDGQVLLEEFYRRFGGELIHSSDGFFYLLPTGDRLGRRHLSLAEMLVGQALALLWLDPCTVESGGIVTRDEVLAHLSRVMGAAALTRALNPKKRRLDERVAEEAVRSKVAEALRRLAGLGFVEALDSDKIRLRSPLMRFAEGVRGEAAQGQALKDLAASGRIVLGDPEDGEAGGGDPDIVREPAGDPDVDGRGGASDTHDERDEDAAEEPWE